MSTTILNITDLIKEIDNARNSAQFSKERTHVNIWFRGQPEHDLSLKPRVYRDHFGRGPEPERLDTERMLMQDFTLQSGSLRDSKATDEEVYFLQQHYRMPTRLLDWTTSPLAALFFAVQDTKENKDGELFMMDASKFRLNKDNGERKYKSWVNGQDFIFVGTAQAGHPIFRDSVRIISWWQASNDKFPEFIIPVRPHYFDVRVGLQRSCFTFHVPKQTAVDVDNNPSLTQFRIPTKEKSEIRKQLGTLGIDAFRVYGDLEHLSETLISAYDLKP